MECDLFVGERGLLYMDISMIINWKVFYICFILKLNEVCDFLWVWEEIRNRVVVSFVKLELVRLVLVLLVFFKIFVFVLFSVMF